MVTLLEQVLIVTLIIELRHPLLSMIFLLYYPTKDLHRRLGLLKYEVTIFPINHISKLNTEQVVIQNSYATK